METTQSEREHLLDMPVDNIVHSLCRDADRLARLEDGIRSLADQMASKAAVEHDQADGSPYHEGRSDQADEDCSCLRGLLRD